MNLRRSIQKDGVVDEVEEEQNEAGVVVPSKPPANSDV